MAKVKRKVKHKEILKGLLWSNLLFLIMNSYYWELDLPKLLIVLLVIDVCCYVSYIYELDLLLEVEGLNKKEEEK